MENRNELFEAIPISGSGLTDDEVRSLAPNIKRDNES